VVKRNFIHVGTFAGRLGVRGFAWRGRGDAHSSVMKRKLPVQSLVVDLLEKGKEENQPQGKKARLVAI